MPLNVRRLYTSGFLVLFAFILFAGAQTPPQTVPQPVTPPTTAPTSGDIMRDRISRAKAFIAVRNYNAAIYELENIRRESNDTALKGVVNVLLMNSYLEQGDYKRAQDFLGEFYNAQKTNKPNAPAFYMAVASQIVKGARDRVERYRALGLSISDRTLPLEAANDLEKMRETLELVITQSKELGKDKVKTPDAMALLEEASNSRGMLGRDDYDARRWGNEVADTREDLANSGRVVMDATNGASNEQPVGNMVAVNTKPLEKPPVIVVGGSNNPVRDQKSTENKPSDQNVAVNDKPTYVPMPPAPIKKEEPKKEEPKPVIETPKTEPVADGSPMDVGAKLKDFATNQPSPVYPQVAKATRTTGVVNVRVTVSETGEVATIDKSTGPGMLQSAARDAIKKWKFKPFQRDGQPVKAIGFVSFSFAL
ncbi:MAG: TonB family protein [Chloracidobacterium sp.]|nr:TonB family protein [Chloracidobacterium sp.]